MYVCVEEDWRQKGAREVSTAEIIEELGKPEHSKTQRKRNNKTSAFNSDADYCMFHL